MHYSCAHMATAGVKGLSAVLISVRGLMLADAVLFNDVHQCRRLCRTRRSSKMFYARHHHHCHIAAFLSPSRVAPFGLETVESVVE